MLQEEEEEERALDLQMEVDRIRALEAYEERERQRLHESQVGAQILADQILDRQKERVRQEELRDLVSSNHLQATMCTKVCMNICMRAKWGLRSLLIRHWKGRRYE